MLPSRVFGARPLAILLGVLLLCCAPTASAERTKLYIQAFVPYDNNVYESEGVIPAAEIAIEHLNDANKTLDLFNNYELVLRINNTMCNPSEGIWQLIQSVVGKEEDQQPIMFLGGGCSLVTEPLAALTGRFYNATQVSYGASSPTLSRRQMFPSFYRTIPSETQTNTLRLALMKKCGWKRVATLYETENVFSETITDFQDRYNATYGSDQSSEDKVDNEDLILRSFTEDPDIPLRQIMEKDFRIIFGWMYEDEAIKTICQAIRKELTMDRHVWVLPAWYSHKWWERVEDVTKSLGKDMNCSIKEFVKALNYTLYMDSYSKPDMDELNVPGVSGYSYNDFYEQYSKRVDANGVENHTYATYTYDALWAMALALDRSEKQLNSKGLNLTHFSYSNIPINNVSVPDVLNASMADVSFSGVSGKVSFDDAGSRNGLNALYQLRPDGDSLKLVLIAVHNYTKDRLNLTLLPNEEILWKGGTKPFDSSKPEFVYLSSAAIYACDTLITIGILVAVALLVFNEVSVYIKPHKLITNSAPHTNTVVILGCMLILCASYLLGIDSETPSVDNYKLEDEFDDLTKEIESGDRLDRRMNRYTWICNVRTVLLIYGFTFSFGALFAKTWQVYRVYTNQKLKNQPFKIWNFFLVLGILLVLDTILIIVWLAADHLKYDITEPQDSGNDIQKIYEHCNCQYFNYFVGTAYVYKGLLVVFGLFLAYESRNIKYIFINDSRYVSIAMYIVVILVGIGAPLSLVLSLHRTIDVDAAYVVTIFTILGACLSCLLILFIPKFVYMALGKETMVRENSQDDVTTAGDVHLGRTGTTIDQSELRTTEDELTTIKGDIQQKNHELHELEADLGVQPLSDGNGNNEPKSTSGNPSPNGSDKDSGVLVVDDGDPPALMDQHQQEKPE